MSQTGIIFAVLAIAFVVTVTMKGSLSKYLGFLGL